MHFSKIITSHNGVDSIKERHKKERKLLVLDLVGNAHNVVHYAGNSGSIIYIER